MKPYRLFMKCLMKCADEIKLSLIVEMPDEIKFMKCLMKCADEIKLSLIVEMPDEIKL